MLLQNQRGQFVLEAILLLTLGISITLFAVKTLRDSKVLAQMVETPWERTAGMIETGVWGPPAQGRTKIPYSHNRMYTPPPIQ